MVIGHDDGDTGSRHPFSEGLGRVTNAVEKGVDALTGHHVEAPAQKKKSGDEDQSQLDQHMPIKDKPEAKKERPRFTDTTKAEPTNDSLVTSSTADPNRSSDPVPGEDEQTQGVRDSDKGIVFHRSSWKCGVVYWRHGFSLPENGRMKIKGDALTFKGIVTSKAFQLNDIDVEKTSRMGGFVHDAFIISVRSTEGKGQDGNGKYFFSTVMKDRKKVLDKIQTAIANVKLGKEEENFDAISGRGGKRGAKTKFRMPPDPTLQKMDSIAKKKLKGVSLQDYYEVAVSSSEDFKLPFIFFSCSFAQSYSHD